MIDRYVSWLEEQSLLHQAAHLARNISGSGMQWQCPYGLPQSENACLSASVWFTAYPLSTIVRRGESVLYGLGDEQLWKIFRDIGIEAIHTGPMRKAGGVIGQEFTPSIDGGFDRISMEIDPKFGDEEDYLRMVRVAQKNDAIIIDDIIPGHTGKGADFLLAKMKFKDYPGLYHMIEIPRTDWDVLPEVSDGHDSVNLPARTVEDLKKKGYILGDLQRVIFYEADVKETNWSATDKVLGIDGVERRWVYLHCFKSGQPTLNWLDPSFAANRVIAGDVIKSIKVLGAKILRLDANGFLGVEIDADKAWSEGNPLHPEHPDSHPLSVIASDTIAMMIRKLGGFSFQELNLSIEAIKRFSCLGADLSYDFITRTAYCHALATRDASFLRLMLNLMHESGLKPGSLVHALQNHDEMTFELVHLDAHSQDTFEYHGKMLTGAQLREIIIEDICATYCRHVSYNLMSGNGLCSTLVGICAAALGVKDLNELDDRKKETIKKAHLLLAAFNAMQPGVFAISGWDLVGDYPLSKEEIPCCLANGDNRWINRGAYDLMDYDPHSTMSQFRIPKARSLYGSLPDQMRDPGSFLSGLTRLLKLRHDCKIFMADQIAVPQVKHESVFIMVHRLPYDAGIEVTALNFGHSAVDEMMSIDDDWLDFRKGLNIIDPLNGTEDYVPSGSGILLRLDALDYKILLIKIPEII